MALRSGIILCYCALHTATFVNADTRSGSFSPDVATMQSWVDDAANYVPVITLGGEEEMVFAFDILRPERDYLRYTLTHCNADWQPSSLSPSEYADGFNEWQIEDYAYSRSAAIPYTHYRISIREPKARPKVSGNYVLSVYDESDPDTVLAQFRFMMTEQTARIDASVSSNTDIDFNKAHQQVSAVIDAEQAGVRDPFNDLILVVSQNGRTDNEAVVKRPTKILNSSTVEYRHVPGLIFEAGNEYRRFETVSNYNPTMGVEQVEYHDPYYHYVLHADEPRADGMYLYDQTLHGGYVVRNELAADNDVEADYGIVHFALDCPLAGDCDIYIDSDFTSRRQDESSRMAYNKHTGMYERSVLLKQGAYSYQYLIMPKDGKQASTALIEGNYYQTDNRYRLIVYAHNPLDRYDRIIAVAEIETLKR